MKVKCAIALLSFLTAVAFFYGTLPEHYDVRGVNDDVLWALVFAALAIAHWVGLRWHDCYACRVWSDTLVYRFRVWRGLQPVARLCRNIRRSTGRWRFFQFWADCVYCLDDG